MICCTNDILDKMGTRELKIFTMLGGAWSQTEFEGRGGDLAAMPGNGFMANAQFKANLAGAEAVGQVSQDSLLQGGKAFEQQPEHFLRAGFSHSGAVANMD